MVLQDLIPLQILQMSKAGPSSIQFEKCGLLSYLSHIFLTLSDFPSRKTFLVIPGIFCIINIHLIYVLQQELSKLYLKHFQWSAILSLYFFRISACRFLLLPNLPLSMIKTGSKTADPGFGFRICCASWDPLEHAKRGFVTHLPCKFFSALKILFEAWLPHSDRQKKMWMFFRTQIHIQCDRYTLCWHYAILTCGMQVLCCLGRPLWRGWFPARDTGKMVSKAVCLYILSDE